MNEEQLAEEAGMVIRRMRPDGADHQRIARWRNQPHVKMHWDHDLPPSTAESIAQEYAADTGREAVCVACIIEKDGRPIGFCQFYPWSAFADELTALGIDPAPGLFGLDIFIGEPGEVNQGAGTRAVRLLIDHLRSRRGALSIGLATAVDNRRAIRAYEKAGLVRQRVVQDTETSNGQRIRSWWMATPAEQASRRR